MPGTHSRGATNSLRCMGQRHRVAEACSRDGTQQVRNNGSWGAWEKGEEVGRKAEEAGGFFKAAAVASLLEHAPREQPDRFWFHLLFTSDESSYCHCPEDNQWERNT